MSWTNNNMLSWPHWSNSSTSLSALTPHPHSTARCKTGINSGFSCKQMWKCLKVVKKNVFDTHNYSESCKTTGRRACELTHAHKISKNNNWEWLGPDPLYCLIWNRMQHPFNYRHGPNDPFLWLILFRINVINSNHNL